MLSLMFLKYNFVNIYIKKKRFINLHANHAAVQNLMCCDFYRLPYLDPLTHLVLDPGSWDILSFDDEQPGLHWRQHPGELHHDHLHQLGDDER